VVLYLNIIFSLLLKASQECEEEDFEGIIDSLLEFNSSINVLCSEVSLVSFTFEVEVEKI